jgi:hypothetical protein
MAYYKIWDREETLYAPDGSEWTKEKILDQYKWMRNPNNKAVITSGVITLGVFMDYESFKQSYKKLGVVTDDMTDEEMLEAVSLHDDKQVNYNPGPSVEERTAAALEALVMLQLPDIE